jgi:hypothetical protein
MLSISFEKMPFMVTGLLHSFFTYLIVPTAFLLLPKGQGSILPNLYGHSFIGWLFSFWLDKLLFPILSQTNPRKEEPQ